MSYLKSTHWNFHDSDVALFTHQLFIMHFTSWLTINVYTRLKFNVYLVGQLSNSGGCFKEDGDSLTNMTEFWRDKNWRHGH